MPGLGYPPMFPWESRRRRYKCQSENRRGLAHFVESSRFDGLTARSFLEEEQNVPVPFSQAVFA